jgi:DNA replication protein DnaC
MATETAPTCQTPESSMSSRPSLSEAVDKLVATFTDGLRNSWQTTLTDAERFKCFKELADECGPRYAGATLDNYDTSAPGQLAVVNQLCGLQKTGLAWCREGGGLVLYGPEGTGKDHLQFAMLRHAVVECGYRAMWRDGLRLQDEIRRAIRDDKEPELRSSLSGPHILAISDPLPPKAEDGAKLNEWNLGWLRDVLDRRYRAKKSTWITFNGASTNDLKAVLTPQLTARLVDDSICIRCNWPSHRGPAKCFG